eukprot:2014057-Prymnesium_polylepis.1
MDVTLALRRRTPGCAPMAVDEGRASEAANLSRQLEELEEELQAPPTPRRPSWMGKARLPHAGRTPLHKYLMHTTDSLRSSMPEASDEGS